MKHKMLLILLFVGFVFTSCDNDNFEYEDRFKDSQEAWSRFKKQTNNTYEYTTTGGTWVGYSWQTTITIYDGKVNRRSFKYTGYPSEVNANLELEWTENVLELGSHKNTPASDVLTLDEVYEKAKQDWLKKRKDTQTYFETKNEGMISLCVYSENNCADDCFRGISIANIKGVVVD
ncbi:MULTISPECIES: hypothetical protein [unclassified Dysgonomonas]|uniref:hypothetical protein n=1 Tax=unclassified Dysgonomonas TaxID=2630389 RepID=UPI0025C15E1F|nr:MULTISPECIES: hypothetical protein [unclassified Dysgonomonas]